MFCVPKIALSHGQFLGAHTPPSNVILLYYKLKCGMWVLNERSDNEPLSSAILQLFARNKAGQKLQQILKTFP